MPRAESHPRSHHREDHLAVRPPHGLAGKHQLLHESLQREADAVAHAHAATGERSDGHSWNRYATGDEESEGLLHRAHLRARCENHVVHRVEIEEPVRTPHGVTVGQLEEKSIFYLQSRGVDVESARNMLTFAFANEMVAKISLPSLHALVLGLLLQRFPQSGVEKDWL